jgi:hypothetical protein
MYKKRVLRRIFKTKRKDVIKDWGKQRKFKFEKNFIQAHTNLILNRSKHYSFQG